MGWRQPALVLAQRGQRLAKLPVDAVGPGSTTGLIADDEAEVFTTVGVSQQGVHLPDPLAQDGGEGFELRQRRVLVLLFRQATHQSIADGTLQGTARPLPATALPGDIAPQDHHRVTRAALRQPAHLAEQRCYRREVALGEEA